MPDAKTCSRCKEAKALDRFYLDRQSSDGRQGKCIPCHRAAKREWSERNQEALKEYRKGVWLAFKALHPEIGTRDQPKRDTRFKKGQPRKPGTGHVFQVGHKINVGRPSPLRGKTHSAETRAKIKAARAKQVITAEMRLKMSVAHRARREKNHFWKGGITAEHAKLRNGVEYRLWREDVFRRDDYTCQSCGSRGGKLHADHIKPFAYFPALRFDVSNGRTLCVPCHKKTDTYLGKAQRYASVLGKEAA